MPARTRRRTWHATQDQASLAVPSVLLAALTLLLAAQPGSGFPGNQGFGTDVYDVGAGFSNAPGNARNDLVRLGVSSDAANLYFFFKVNAPYAPTPSPPPAGDFAADTALYDVDFDDDNTAGSFYSGQWTWRASTASWPRQNLYAGGVSVGTTPSPVWRCNELMTTVPLSLFPVAPTAITIRSAYTSSDPAPAPGTLYDLATADFAYALGSPTTPSDQATGLSATPGSLFVTLAWTAPVGGPAPVSYNVYRGTSPGALSLLANTGSTATTYTDNAVAAGTTYHYAVAAVVCDGTIGPVSTEVSATTPAGPPPPPFTLTSPAFIEGGPIPVLYTCDGSDISPPLQVANVPPGTARLALTVEDPDAFGFVHWTYWDLPAAVTSLPANANLPALGATEGLNDFALVGYGGPCPPAQHDYVFTAYALSAPVGLPSGSSFPALMAAMGGLVLASDTLTGYYDPFGAPPPPVPPPPPPPPPPSPPPPPLDPPALQVTLSGPRGALPGSALSLLATPTGGTPGYTCAWQAPTGALEPSSCAATVRFGRVGVHEVVVQVTDAQNATTTASLIVRVGAEETDADQDGVPDGADVCPSVADHAQGDADGDGLGDACDPTPCDERCVNQPEAQLRSALTRPDADRDGWTDAQDNCPSVANYGQDDADMDGLGDLCDEDVDGDGRANLDDDCPHGPAACAPAPAPPAPNRGSGIRHAAEAQPASMPMAGLAYAALGFVAAFSAALLAVAAFTRRK